MTTSQIKKVLLLILVITAIMRFGALSRGDTVNDEVYYGFRAVGPTDFTASIQTTPLEWWDEETPAWTKLSFHDHPPLVFWIQHISLSVFGENNFGLRFSSALFGVASVYIMFLLGALIFTPTAGLISSALLSVTVGHVFISRVGMQESFVIFFLLAVSYFFLRSLKDERYLIPTGLFLGLALITKYTAVILVPLLLIYLALYKREYFQNRRFWVGVFLALFIVSPVIIYNLLLYRTAGHFDLQISAVLGQIPDVWEGALGKEVGTLGERILAFVPKLISSNSWLFIVVAVISLVFLRNAFLALMLGLLALLILVIGPSARFLTMLTPFLALSIGGLFEKKEYLLFLLIPIFAFELFYSFNNQIAYYPVGGNPWLSSNIRLENYNWGYNALGDFLEKELEGRIPGIIFNSRYSFIQNAQDESVKGGLQKGKSTFPALIVVYGNIDRGARLWILDRLHIYHGWPIISMETYQKHLRESGKNYYENSGFQNYYFIQSTNIVPDQEFLSSVEGLEIISIKNPRNDEVFRVYQR